MVSHEYKCIFIHIPKCAGTSIESALGHLDGYQGRDGQDHRSLRMLEIPSLYTLLSIENIIEYRRRVKNQKDNNIDNKRSKIIPTKEQYDNYFKFVVVRNPWSRAFSWYKNVMRDGIHRKTHGITSNITLNQFLKYNIGKGMLRPQTYWLKNYKGQISFDYVGRFEALQDVFKEIKHCLNLSGIEFPHKISGDGEDYRSEYDNESIELVKNVYREEIQLFDYTFKS